MPSKLVLERGTDVLLLETGDALLLESAFEYNPGWLRNRFTEKLSVNTGEKLELSDDAKLTTSERG